MLLLCASMHVIAVQLLQGESVPEPQTGPLHHQRDPGSWSMQRILVPVQWPLCPARPASSALSAPEPHQLPHPAQPQQHIYRHRVAFTAWAAASCRTIPLPLLSGLWGRALWQHWANTGRGGWGEGQGQGRAGTRGRELSCVCGKCLFTGCAACFVYF